MKTVELNFSEIDSFLVKKESLQPIISIVGPTCTGKTSMSLYLAKKLGLEIINADSRLIFDEMNIGTAKPAIEELASVKHHLVNIRKPSEVYSSGDYRNDFDNVISDLEKAIVVGGTGMYLRSALEDLDMSGVDGDIEFRKNLESRDLEFLQSELKEKDPEAYETIDVNNKRRLARALEVIKISGQKFSELNKKLSGDRHDTLWLGLNFRNRDLLYTLINERVTKMIDMGLVDEVKALVDKYGVTHTIRSTIGYGEIVQYLENEISLDEAIALIQKKTRNYAKRQITWFKANPRIHWFFLEDLLS